MAYATKSTLTDLGCPQTALVNLVDTQINAQLQAGADFMDTFFAARWGRANVPLVAWDSTVELNNARITIWYLVTTRGLQAGNPDYNIFRLGYDDAVDWCNKVQRQQAHPLVTLAGTAPQQPNLVSSSVVSIMNGRRCPNRGW